MAKLMGKFITGLIQGKRDWQWESTQPGLPKKQVTTTRESALGKTRHLLLAMKYDIRNSGLPTKFLEFCLQKIVLRLCKSCVSHVCPFFPKYSIQSPFSKTLKCMPASSMFLPLCYWDRSYHKFQFWNINCCWVWLVLHHHRALLLELILW